MTVRPCVKEVTVRVARAHERRKWDALMFEHHYLGFIQFAGRGLRYVAARPSWTRAGSRAPCTGRGTGATWDARAASRAATGDTPKLLRSSEYAYGITSLSPEQAGPERLVALNRGHWTIENQNHRHRDTTFAEDACLMRTRLGPSNNAVLNNIAFAIIFRSGFPGVEAAVQHFAMDRDKATRAITQPG